MLIHNDIFHNRLEFIYLTTTEDPQVGLLLIFLVDSLDLSQFYVQF